MLAPAARPIKLVYLIAACGMSVCEAAARAGIGGSD
jgi:hypothetical protein